MYMADLCFPFGKHFFWYNAIGLSSAGGGMLPVEVSPLPISLEHLDIFLQLLPL